MQFKLISVILAIAAGVIAIPAENNVTAETSVDAKGLHFQGTPTSAFKARGLEARCGENFPPHSDCVIGQCQCSAGYGCYSCNGGRVQCQPGPGSGECWQ